MEIVARHIVGEVVANQRFQEYGVDIFPQISTKSALKKAIKRKQILINQQPASTAHYVKKGDVIELMAFEQKPHKVYHLTLKVLYEDDYLAVVYKPAGISVSGNKFATITNALSQNLKPSKQADATHPHPVHRLDYATSGLLMLGKTLKVRQLLHDMFEQQSIQKTYHAVCVGAFAQEMGSIIEPLDNKEAFTAYRIIQSVKSERFDFLNLVELKPQTGRTHQLRKHLLMLGNPIMGDQKYFIPSYKHQGYGLYLHATALSFKHPIGGKYITIVSELPVKFKRIFGLI